MMAPVPAGAIDLSGDYIDGADNTCQDFSLFIAPAVLIESMPDPGWVLVRGRDGSVPLFRSATGKVVGAKVTHTDFPDVHDSHDFNVDIVLDKLDPDGAGLPLLSQAGRDDDKDGNPDSIELEWETGILTTEEYDDGSARFFPKWAWPHVGDRLWTNGYWVFDCGHPTEGASRTEIHPPRAVASMRQQVATPPGSPAPVPVTATDLYIHGRAGVVTDLLFCKNSAILYPHNCSTVPDYEFTVGCDASDGYCHNPVTDHMGIPIAENFSFEICVPPRPAADATLATWFTNGPDNTVSDPALQVDLETIAVGEAGSDPCAAPEFGPEKVLVSVNLAGSGVTPDDIYSRHIYAGWVDAPVTLRRFVVNLDSLYMRNDHDSDFLGIDDKGELSFFWAGMDKGGGPDEFSDEWIRLNDFASKNMGNLGSGETVNFNGAVWDVTVPDGKAFTIRANGYDGGVYESVASIATDCLDDHFGHHDMSAHLDVFPVPPYFELLDTCYLLLSISAGQPDNDALRPLTAEFGPGNNYRVGQSALPADNYCTVHIGFPGAPFSFEVPLPCEGPERAEFIQAVEDENYEIKGFSSIIDYDFRVSVEEIPMDSDGDGLLDTDEINIYGTDPLDYDTDDDGLSDGDEINRGTDPLDGDSDDDGLNDGEEVDLGTDPLNPDTDDDGLFDGPEVELGTNPFDEDSDGDGILDGSDPDSFANWVSNLPAAAFKSGDTGLRDGILDLLEEMEAKIAAGQTADALKLLRNLIGKVDGCGVKPDKTDWIIDCTIQVKFREFMLILQSNLQS